MSRRQFYNCLTSRRIAGWSHGSWRTSPGMQDDLSTQEGHAIILLASIAYVDGVSAEQILRMSFLDSFELDDLVIL